MILQLIHGQKKRLFPQISSNDWHVASAAMDDQIFVTGIFARGLFIYNILNDSWSESTLELLKEVTMLVLRLVLGRL